MVADSSVTPWERSVAILYVTPQLPLPAAPSVQRVSVARAEASDSSKRMLRSFCLQEAVDGNRHRRMAAMAMWWCTSEAAVLCCLCPVRLGPEVDREPLLSLFGREDKARRRTAAVFAFGCACLSCVTAPSSLAPRPLSSVSCARAAVQLMTLQRPNTQGHSRALSHAPLLPALSPESACTAPVGGPRHPTCRALPAKPLPTLSPPFDLLLRVLSTPPSPPSFDPIQTALHLSHRHRLYPLLPSFLHQLARPLLPAPPSSPANAQPPLCPSPLCPALYPQLPLRLRSPPAPSSPPLPP